MRTGSRIYINEKVTGILLGQGGLPSIHTMQPGQSAMVLRMISEPDMVEIDAGGQRMLFSLEALRSHSYMVSAA